MNSSTLPPLQIVREVDEPLGLFYRPGRTDHKALATLLARSASSFSGAVFDATSAAMQEELRSELVLKNLYAILDPASLELAAPGGFTPARSKLPWAQITMDVVDDFTAGRIDAVAETIADFVTEHGFNGVLAPCHYLDSGYRDPWFAIDRRLTARLRHHLDANRRADCGIFYPLATSTNVLFDSAQRTGIKASLSNLPLQGVWLRVHPFGNDSTDTKLLRLILACQDLHGSKVPLVAEKTGSVGLALLGFGAVGGMECGVSTGEKFDFARLKRPLTGQKPFAVHPRVYVPDLGIFLPAKEAKEFFAIRGLRHFSCRDTNCCPRGVESMIADPRPHFLRRRMVEVDLLSGFPQQLRPNGYLDQILRPATDNIGRAFAHPELPNATRARLERNRRKLDGWRASLGELSRVSPPQTFSAPVERRIQQIRATA